MTLQGSFVTMPFPDLLQWIGDARSSGILSVSLAIDVRYFQVTNGEITGLGAADPRAHDLVRLLLGRGLIDETLLHRVLERSASEPRSLQKIILDEGHVERSSLAQAVRSHVKDAVLQVFLWEQGQFVFTATAESSLLEPPSWDLSVNPSVPVAEVLMDAMRRLDDWRHISEVFPSDYVMLHAIAPAPDLPAVDALHEAREPLALVDLCLRLDRPRFAILEELYEGWRRGVVAAEATPAELAATPGSTPVQHLLDAARTLAGEQQYDEATALLRTVLNLDASHSEARRLLNDAHKAQLEQLYREFPPYRVPVATVDRSRLDNVTLAPRERYLLLRIDGRWDVATLTAITPLGELETLRALKKFLQLGLISLSVSRPA